MSPDSHNFSDPGFEKAMILLEADYKVFFVEGKTDQTLFLRLYEDAQSVWFAVPDNDPTKCGRTAVEKIVNQLQPSYPDSLFGICDRDFDALLEDAPMHPNIFYTDFHDIVIDASHYSPFMENFLENSVSPVKQESQGFTKEEAIRISKAYAAVIGSLRLLSIRENMNLTFTNYKVKIGKHLNHDFSPNVEAILEGFLKSDQKNRPFLARSAELLEKALACMAESRGEELHLIQGHDFLKVFCEFFNKIQLGRRSKKTSVDFEDLLLTGYQSEEFNQSNLGVDLAAVI